MRRNTETVAAASSAATSRTTDQSTSSLATGWTPTSASEPAIPVVRAGSVSSLRAAFAAVSGAGWISTVVPARSIAVRSSAVRAPA